MRKWVAYVVLAYLAIVGAGFLGRRTVDAQCLMPTGWTACDNFASVNACVASVNAAGGGIAYLGTPKTGSSGYTITQPLVLGANKTSPTPARTVLIGVPGVRIICNLTGNQAWQDCIDLADGSGMWCFNVANSLNANSTVAACQLLLASGASVGNMIGVADPSGVNEQSAWVNGWMLGHASGTALVAQADLHVLGLFSGSRFSNITDSDEHNIGILVDNPDKSTITPTSVSVSGSTVTVTVATSTTATPTGHHVQWNSFVKLSACSQAGLNGSAFPVANLGSGLGTVADAQTKFQLTVAGLTAGSVTSCTYTSVAPNGGTVQALTTVITFDNIVSNGSGNTGSRPLVISSNGAGAPSSLAFIGTQNYEAPDAAFPNIEINGNGSAISGQTPYGIDFGGSHLHIEPANGATAPSPGVKIANAHDIVFGGIDVSGCGACSTGTILDFSQTTSNATYNLRVGPIFAFNWPVVKVDHITPNTVNNPNTSGGWSYGGLQYLGTGPGGNAITQN